MPLMFAQLVFAMGVLAPPAHVESRIDSVANSPYFDAVCQVPTAQFITLNSSPVRRTIWSEGASQFPPAREYIRPVGGGPGGATLLLSAFATLGLWRLGRAAKFVPHVPDWCHASGPQLGHTRAIEFDVHGPCVMDSALVFLDSVHESQPFFGSLVSFNWVCQFRTFTTSPRSPPSFRSI